MKAFGILCAAAFILAAPAAKADDVTFTYQGRVLVNGAPHNGTGNFKFAVVSTAGNRTLWTNDGTADGEPAASIPLPVDNGVFSVMIGDPALGMVPLNSSIFSTRRPLKLRVWVNCANNGFQQLSPDQKLVDLTLNTVSTGLADYTIYVNGATGDDDNNGLTTGTAKKTMQGGIDAVPPQLRCNVTVKVFPGDYKESVRLSGINGGGYTLFLNRTVVGNRLRILGDDTWTSTSPGSPNVRILGADIDATTASRVRDFTFFAQNNSATEIEGLHFDLAGNAGAEFRTGSYIVKRCKATRAVFTGYSGGAGATLALFDCVANSNGHGFSVGSSTAVMAGDVATSNTYNGLYVVRNASCAMYGGCKFNGNNWSGINAWDLSVLDITPGNEMKSNGQYGIYLVYGATSKGHGASTISGNTLGSYGSNPGGVFY